MKKRLTSILLIMVMVASLFVGCSKSNGSNDQAPDSSKEGSTGVTNEEKKKVTIWAWDEKFNIAVMKEAARIYADINPDVSFDIVSLSKEDVYVKLQTGLAGGGSGLPDIVLLEDYVSGKYLNTFKGSFADLTGHLNFDNFVEFKVEAVSQEGKVYAVPFDTGATSLYYRKDLIEQAGYTEEDMKDLTWSEFIEIGKKVTEVTGVQMIVEIANNKTSLIRTMIQSAGLWYFDKNGDINIKNNAALKEAFTIIKQMKDAGILFEAESTEGRASALNNGNVASVANAPWFVSALRAAEDQAGLWRATSTPRMENIPESINASNVGGSSWYVMNNSKVKDEAIAFLAEMYDGNMEFYENILLNQGAMSSYIPFYPSDVFETEDAFFGGQKINKLFAETLPKVQPVNYGGYVSEANDAVTVALAEVFLGNLSIDEALSQAEDQLANQLGR